MSFTATCAVPGCDRQPHSKAKHGLCQLHYERLRNHGDVNYVPGPLRFHDPIPDDVKAQVVAAIRRFENPLVVAKRHGISRHAVMDIMNKSRAA